ncbi:hypothetical protein Lser_V15G05215 [Lactuca serriola]
MKPGVAAQQLWNRLSEILQDNKATRAVYLEEQFTSTRLDAFASVTEYCACLKNLADQLTNVGNLVSEQKMVLQFVSGLTKETRGNKQDTHAPQALATQTSDSPNLHVHSQNSDNNTSRNFRSDHGDHGGYRGGGHRGGGRGYRGRGRGRSHYTQQNYTQQNPWQQAALYLASQLTSPPCPYPTTPPQFIQ